MLNKERREVLKKMKAEIVEVIRTENVEGNGTEEDPVRTVVRYWEKSGKLISEEVLTLR